MFFISKLYISMFLLSSMLEDETNVSHRW